MKTTGRRAGWAGVLVVAGLAGLGAAEGTGNGGRTPEAAWRRLRAELPATPRRPVAHTYFGTRVLDPYQWLEDGHDGRVQSWMRQEDEVARKFLDAVPGEKLLERRLREILSARTVRWSHPRQAGGLLFVLKTEPPRQQPFLVAAPGPDSVDEARVVVDPNRLDPEGHTAIDWYRPSPDGKLVAVSLSRNGSEAGDLHFYDGTTGAVRFETIPDVQKGTAGGDACWTPDGKGVFYTRYPREGERAVADRDFYQQIWFHRLGTPVADDRYELGRDFPRLAETRLRSSGATGEVLAIVQEGDSGRFQHYLRGADGGWAQLTTYADQVTGAEFGPDRALYLISLKDAPRGRILRLPRGARELGEATPAVAEQEGSLQWDFYSGDSFAPTADRLYAVYQVGGPTELRTFRLPSGEPAPGPSVPAVSDVRGVRALPVHGVLFARASYTEPSAWYLYDPDSGETRETAMRSSSPVSFGDATVERRFATSRDGTQVPFVVLMKKGTPLDGDNPVRATAYGGFGISAVPHFDPTLRVWLDHGGVFVQASVRGGGEYGEEWHREGSGLLKQNTFDDFAAVLQWLVDHRYTRPERLAIVGGSNGGILMGAMITQHPGMERAVVSSVGIYDMLRNELTPNGQFNVPEYGSVKNEAQFRALYAYSPYHHVVAGTAYPAVLLTAGAHDPRVDPRQSRKFAAALQAASTSGEPVLLRVDYRAGHGLDASLDQRVALAAHVDAFLMDELGMLDARARPAGASRH
jgi:prolyl oligopeptidase